MSPLARSATSISCFDRHAFRFDGAHGWEEGPGLHAWERGKVNETCLCERTVVPWVPSVRVLLRVCQFGQKRHGEGAQGRRRAPEHPIEEGPGGISFAVACRHCSEPLCVRGCISGALQVRDGVVTIDESKCVGCYTCVASCPYGAVLPGAHGAVQKCELCTQSGGVPACVEHCPNKAIVFEERGAGA